MMNEMLRNILKKMREAVSNTLHIGDSAYVLKEIPNKSIDCITTDPPYGYSFMGKDWDKVVPSIVIWRECYRVLKPGAFMFVMSAPRQDVLSEMIMRLGKAGFDTGFTSIYWTYASGFPKAMNIGKAVDKKLGVEPEVVGIVKGMGKQNPDWNGTNQGRTENFFKPEYEKVKATSSQAQALDGSYGGFQPKPAVEVVIVCMKPLSEKTYVDQALKNGKGVTWLDNARIPSSEIIHTPQSNPEKHEGVVGTDLGITNSDITKFQESQRLSIEKLNSIGRFPANLLVSNDVLNDGKITKGAGGNKSGVSAIFDNANAVIPIERYNDVGSFSRYFDLDAWFEKAVSELPVEVQKTFPFLICPKASKSERNKDCDGLDNETYVDDTRNDKDAVGRNNPRNRSGTVKIGNTHPTVKPLKLMCWLVTLGSRKGDTILDPFCGSGTTGLASKILDRKFIGIELNPEYVEIEKARIGTDNVVTHESTPPSVKPIKESDVCPACGSEMRKIGKNYYCTKANCTGKGD